MLINSLVVVHDGSHQPKMAREVCSGVVMIRCKWTGLYASCAFTKKATRLTANNYCGEILGDIITQLILRAAIEGHHMPLWATLRCDCDNLGVVGHGQN